MGKAFEGMIHALYRQEGAMLDIQVIQEPEVTDFIGTHADALNHSMQQVSMSDAMRHRLERSNFIFSGFKAFHELNEAFPSLIDENGERKPFERFLNDVQAIDSTYNKNYLRAEYNFCQASADMAAKWEQIEADGDRYNLQYRTQHDDKVRPEHAALDGVTLPPSDPFWESYYPPNGWNCRCTVAQVRKSKYPTTDPEEARARGEEALQKDTRGIFRFNSGKQGKTFPDYNPYTISRCRDCDIAQGKVNLAYIPDNEFCNACPLIRECASKMEQRQKYERYKNDPDYFNVQYDEKTGAVRATHKGHNCIHNPKDDQRFFGNMTKEDLEEECVSNIFRMGHSAILRDEGALLRLKQTPAALDLELDDNIMDIASITGKHCGGALSRKNDQLQRVYEQSRIESDCVCLYFHKAEMFSESQLLHDVVWYKQKMVEWNQPRLIKHIYCVINGADDILIYDI